VRRVLVAVVLTVAGLVALLSFRTHTNASERTVGSPQSVPPLLPGEHALTGRAARTVYGPVQVRVVERSRKIVGVTILQHPAETPMDIQIGQFAFPRLVGETLVAQSARIDSVSGATYTSGGYISSLQSALDKQSAVGQQTGLQGALGNGD
jgi:uncharacterized protein with FMN-binding domain